MQFDHDEIRARTPVLARQRSHLPLFRLRERAQRVGPRIGQGLYLDDKLLDAVPGNNVEFAATDPYVTFEDLDSLSNEKLASHILTESAECNTIHGWGPTNRSGRV